MRLVASGKTVSVGPDEPEEARIPAFVAIAIYVSVGLDLDIFENGDLRKVAG
jgi:hypothetical protein